MSDYELKLFDSSRYLADSLVKEIGSDQDKFNEMFALSMRDKYPVSMRAARVMQLCTEKHSSLIQPHIDAVIQALPLLKVEGVRRSYLKMMIEVIEAVNEDQLGILTDLCFRWIKDMKQAIAVRAYSMDILVKVISKYPDLRFEMIEILETIEKSDEGAMLGKCQSILSDLRKYTDKT